MEINGVFKEKTSLSTDEEMFEFNSVYTCSGTVLMFGFTNLINSSSGINIFNCTVTVKKFPPFYYL